jgi:hypothetical protein
LTSRRLNVQQASEALGISVDAVRMRSRRGSLASEHEDGRLYVWVNVDETYDETGVGNPATRALIEELRGQVTFLRDQLEQEREENRRKDHLLAAALERIPAIEAPPDERDASVSASEESGKGPGHPQREEPERRSWWQRMFGTGYWGG